MMTRECETEVLKQVQESIRVGARGLLMDMDKASGVETHRDIEYASNMLKFIAGIENLDTLLGVYSNVEALFLNLYIPSEIAHFLSGIHDSITSIIGESFEPKVYSAIYNTTPKHTVDTVNQVSRWILNQGDTLRFNWKKLLNGEMYLEMEIIDPLDNRFKVVAGTVTVHKNDLEDNVHVFEIDTAYHYMRAHKLISLDLV